MKQVIGILGWLGVALVVAAVGFKIAPAFMSEPKPEWAEWSRYLAIVGLVVTVTYGLAQWREIRRSFSGRSTQYGSIAAGSVLVFLGILVAANWISNRQNKRWDLTDTKQFSLSDQTRQIITTLKAPLKITVFYQGKQGDTSQNYRDRLDAYQYLSKQVSLDFIDVDKQPTEADKNAVTAVPTLILQYGTRTQRATSADEQAVTNALKKVIEGTAKKAYFTEGHGERDFDDPQARSGVAAISNALKDDNFEVAKLQIAQKGSIPADATVLVIAGPTGDFLPQETELVRGYLKNGGKVMLMLDPPAKGGTVQATSLIALAKEWGMQVGEDIVIDPNGQQIGADASVPVGMPVPSQPITKDFKRITAFPIARSVIPVTGGIDGKTAQTFVQSGPTSWSEADVKSLYATGQPKKELDKGDKNGPVSIGAAASAPAAGAAGAATESRIVVFGDSDFATNNYVSVQGNGDLFLNAMNWLAQQENLISIRPKNPEDRRLQLTADKQVLVNWFTLAIMPLLLFGNAFRLYWKRR